MAKGLDKILEKIRANPRQTLIGRYLSLVTDIPDEDERAGLALDLAEAIVKLKPNDALNISFMIYQSGRHVIRSLQIVIDCFEVKGRAGKVAVLKMELEKLLKEKGEPPTPVRSKKRSDLPVKSRPASAPAFAQDNKGAKSVGQFSINEASLLQAMGHELDGRPSEHTRMAELDLGDFQEEVSEHHPVDFLFPDNQESGVHKLPQQMLVQHGAPVQQSVDWKPEPELKIAEGFFAGFTGRPGDTVLPVMPSRMPGDEEEESGTVVSLIEFPENFRNNLPGKTVNLNDLPRITLDKPLVREKPVLQEVSRSAPLVDAASEPALEWRTPERPVRQTVAPKIKPRTAAPSELFDRLFNSKRFEEAESILEQSVSDKGFDWWRSRYDRLQLLKEPGYVFGLAHIVVAPVVPARETEVFVSLTLDDSITAKKDAPERSGSALLHLAVKEVELTPNQAQPFSGDLRKGVITEILRISDSITTQTQMKSSGNSAGDISPALMARLLALTVESEESSKDFFELLQGIFAGGASDQLIELIEKKSLKYRDAFWFGFYLNALLQCGYGRKIVAESVIVSERHPTLSWLRVIWRRLPLAWDLMGIVGFQWAEDDGVWDFLEKISRRGRQRLKSYSLSVHPE